MREKIRTETAKKVADKKLADYLASLTEKDIVDSYFLDNDTFTIRFSSYGNESVVNNINEIIYNNDLVDFFAEIWLDDGTLHYIFDYEYDNMVLQGENGYLDENIGTWKQHLDNDVCMYREENPQEVKASREDFIKEFTNDVCRDIELWSKWEPENDPESVRDDIESMLFDVVFPELLKKCQDELKNWKAIQLKELKGEEIFKCAYECTYKKELLTILENSDFDLSTYIWLYNKDLPLDYLYSVWLHCDASVTDILIDMILEEEKMELND